MMTSNQMPKGVTLRPDVKKEGGPQGQTYNLIFQNKSVSKYVLEESPAGVPFSTTEHWCRAVILHAHGAQDPVPSTLKKKKKFPKKTAK